MCYTSACHFSNDRQRRSALLVYASVFRMCVCVCRLISSATHDFFSARYLLPKGSYWSQLQSYTCVCVCVFHSGPADSPRIADPQELASAQRRTPQPAGPRRKSSQAEYVKPDPRYLVCGMKKCIITALNEKKRGRKGSGVLEGWE